MPPLNKLAFFAFQTSEKRDCDSIRLEGIPFLGICSERTGGSAVIMTVVLVKQGAGCIVELVRCSYLLKQFEWLVFAGEEPDPTPASQGNPSVRIEMPAFLGGGQGG
jgi:hypothetical protein